jgi:hypothetical protein
MMMTVTKRYSVSVSGATYARLRSAVSGKSLQRFLDDLVMSALGDPMISARVVGKCKAAEAK